jgi:hypothetical protein
LRDETHLQTKLLYLEPSSAQIMIQESCIGLENNCDAVRLSPITRIATHHILSSALHLLDIPPLLTLNSSHTRTQYQHANKEAHANDVWVFCQCSKKVTGLEKAES